MKKKMKKKELCPIGQVVPSFFLVNAPDEKTTKIKSGEKIGSFLIKT